MWPGLHKTDWLVYSYEGERATGVSGWDNWTSLWWLRMNSIMTITSNSRILEFYPSNSSYTDQPISDKTEMELRPNKHEQGGWPDIKQNMETAYLLHQLCRREPICPWMVDIFAVLSNWSWEVLICSLRECRGDRLCSTWLTWSWRFSGLTPLHTSQWLGGFFTVATKSSSSVFCTSPLLIPVLAPFRAPQDTALVVSLSSLAPPLLVLS